MFSFFFAPTYIGLQCTDTVIRAVLIKKGCVEGRVRGVLPSGIIANGIIRDPAKCKEILITILTKLTPDFRRASIALCLPPEKVYCQALSLLPDQSGKPGVLRDIASLILPEPWEELKIVSRPFSKGPKGLVLVCAVRKDFLQSYLDLCTSTGSRMRCIASASSFMGAALQKTLEKHAHPLLVYEPSDPSESATITLFQEGQPIEELIVRDSSTLPSAVFTFCQQEKQRQIIIDSISALGSSELITKLQAALSPVTPKKAKPKAAPKKKTKKAEADIETVSEPVIQAAIIPVESAVPKLSEKDREWVCVEAAGMEAKGGVVSFV